MKKIIVLLLCVLTITVISCVPATAQAQQLKRTSDGWEQVSQSPASKDSLDTKEYYTYKGKKYKIWLSSRGSAYAWIPKTRSQGMRKKYLGKDQNIFYQQKMEFNAKKSEK